eukprot:3288571-Prymnesium_polylepis.1
MMTGWLHTSEATLAVPSHDHYKCQICLQNFMLTFQIYKLPVTAKVAQVAASRFDGWEKVWFRK